MGVRKQHFATLVPSVADQPCIAGNRSPTDNPRRRIHSQFSPQHIGPFLMSGPTTRGRKKRKTHILTATPIQM